MIYFDVILSGGGKVIIGEDELETVVKAIARGDKMIVCRQGIFNPSYYISIERSKKTAEEQKELAQYGMKYEEPSSPFAKILSGRMQGLSGEDKKKLLN